MPRKAKLTEEHCEQFVAGNVASREMSDGLDACPTSIAKYMRELVGALRKMAHCSGRHPSEPLNLLMLEDTNLINHCFGGDVWQAHSKKTYFNICAVALQVLQLPDWSIVCATHEVSRIKVAR
jgi:hypothetical protein